MRPVFRSPASLPSAAPSGPEAAAPGGTFGARRDPFRRTARPVPGLGRTAAALDAMGAAPATESRLGALVLCMAAVLHPSDPATGSMGVRPLAIAHRLGADVHDVRRGLARLARAGLLRLDVANGSIESDTIAATATWERVAAPAIASSVDWPAVVERLGGHPAALAVALAFAEATVAPGEQTPITVPQLVAGARYSDRTVKGALAQLVDAGVLVRGTRIGARSRYAFSDAALGLIPFATEVEAVPTSAGQVVEPTIVAQLAALRRDIGALGDRLAHHTLVGGSMVSEELTSEALAVQGTEAASLAASVQTAFLEIHGTRLALPPGATLLLETDEAGRFWYRMGVVRFGPISE